jgi:hypothetical protein
MADNNPFLFVHLPLDEIRHGQVLDLSPNCRHGLSHNAKIVADETFGACLEFTGYSFVKFPDWKLSPAVFLPRAADSPPPGALLKLTFTLWLTPPSAPGGRTLIDAGLGKDLQRFTVGFKRQDDSRLVFTVQAPAPGEVEKTRGFRWTSQPIAADGPWVHFAVVWDPKNSGPDICSMFLNGAPLIVATVELGTKPVSGEPVGGTLLGSTFLGMLAHFRIYTRELAQQEIAQEIDRDLARRRKAGLLECSLLDPLENPLPLMFLYPSSAPMAEKMTLAVKPLRGGMKLAKLPAEPPAPDKCHFELRFRPGVLNLSRTVERVTADPPGAWQATTYAPQAGTLGHVAVCIRCNSEKDLAQNVPLKLVLDSLRADERFGSRFTRIDLRYHNLIVAPGSPPTSGRIPQWLLLWPREQPGSAALILASEDWIQDPRTALSVSSGNTLLQGRLVCANAQAMMKRQMWGPEWGNTPKYFAKMVAYLPLGYSPSPRADLRFAGRARWFSADSPEPLWSSDLWIWSHGTLGIDAEKLLTGNVYYRVVRIEVSLDGVSYASDESLLRAGET